MSGELQIRDEQVQSELFQIMPELEIRFREKFENLYDFATENPGGHLLFEDIVFPYIKEIAGDPSKEQTLKTLFGFFEKMASSTDPPVLNLFGIAITEQLAANIELHRQVKPFIGPRTSQMVDLDMKFLGATAAQRT